MSLKAQFPSFKTFLHFNTWRSRKTHGLDVWLLMQTKITLAFFTSSVLIKHKSIVRHFILSTRINSRLVLPILWGILKDMMHYYLRNNIRLKVSNTYNWRLTLLQGNNIFMCALRGCLHAMMLIACSILLSSIIHFFY